MKLSYLLINLVLVGGGIFIYDQLKTPDRASTDHINYDDPLTADAPDGSDGKVAATLTSGGAGMRGSHDKATIRALEDRLASLERIVSRLPRKTAGGTVLPTGGKLPELSATDFIDPDNPSYDEKTIQTIAAYMEEITRRKQIERQRERVGGEIDRLGIELSAEQKKGLVDETLKFQDRARELLRQGWTRDEKGREERKAAFQGLQEEFTTTIDNLVPTEAAEKIKNSRIARGMGFYAGGNNRRGARFGGGRKNGASER